MASISQLKMCMKFILLSLLMLRAFSLASAQQSPAAAPQKNTGVTGTVTDSSGAVVLGASVTVLNSAGESKTAVTDGEGKFQVVGLAPGKYVVSVSAGGFAEFKAEGVKVTAGELTSLAFQLQLAGTSTQVNVQAQRAAQIETQNAEVSGTITKAELVSLGLNGRNFTQLIALAPGVSNQTSQDEAKVGVAGSAKYSVNGGRVEYNTFEVDGSDVLNTDIAASHGHTTLLIYPSLDAIQELKVLTSNYGAMYGRTASGTVQVGIKSGGSQLHGNAYEFLRNELFNARNFFDPPGKAPLYRRNDFGATLGGPVYIPNLFNDTKDKTFFFLSEEFRLERSPFSFNQGVPSDAERGYDPVMQTYTNVGDFSDVCPAGGNFNQAQYPDCPSVGLGSNNRGTYAIPGTNLVYIDPAAEAILQTGIIPRANSTTGCNSSIDSCYVGTVSPRTSWREELIRLDHNFTSSTRISFHGIHDHWDTTTGVPQWANVVNSFPSVLNNFDGPGMSLITTITSLISPTMVNSFSSGYTWQHIKLTDLPGPGVTLSRAGLNALQYPFGYLFDNGERGELPGVIIAGNNQAYGGYGFAADTSYMPWSHLLDKTTFRDDLSKVWGKHTVQLGIQVVRAGRTENSAVNGANTGDLQGLLTFQNTDSANTSGNAFADFLNAYGSNSSFNPLSSEAIRYFQQDDMQATYRISYWDAEPYIQDDWRVSSRLTLNLGLRLSLFGNWEPTGQNLYNWVPQGYDPAIWSGSGYAVNYYQGFLQNGYNSAVPLNVNNLDPTVTNGLVECGKNSIPASCQTAHVLNPAPRVGFAWDPWGNGKTSVRGGYGMFYEHGTGSEANAGSLMGNPPQVLSMTEENPQNYNLIGTVANGVHALYPLNVMSIPTTAVWPYSQQWSFGVQRQLAPDTIATIAYVGSKGTHLSTAMQLNQLPPVPASLNPFYPGEPITSGICEANQISYDDPFDPTGYFYLNGANLYYGPPGAPTNAPVLALIAACNGTPATPTKGPISFDINMLRPYQGVSNISAIRNLANSIYNSMQITLRRHRGPLDLAASYTWGHSLDTASDRYSATFVDSYDLYANRASSDFDERQMLNLSYTYELPLLKTAARINDFLGGDKGPGLPFMDAAFRNWTLSGITVYQSGTPFSVINEASASGISVLDNAGLALGLAADSYPDIAPGGGVCNTPINTPGSGTFGPVLRNRCRFMAPRGLTQGDAGRNSMNNPGRTNFDWALLRNFKILGERNLQFRAEAFNIFNTTQFRIFDPVKGNTGSNTISCYGDITSNYSAGDPSCYNGNGFLRPVDAHRSRTIQLGLKFDF